MTDPHAAAKDTDPRIKGVAFVGSMIVVMWVVQVISVADDYRLDPKLGIVPRDVDGLDGIVFSPFLHASWGHLTGNTIPFAVLGSIVALSGIRRVLAVTGIVALVGGLGTWLISPANVYVVGASGVIFGYAAYLVARGVFNRNLVHLGGGVLVAVLYGATLIGGLVPQDHVSWQGHLCGGIGGVVAAWLLAPSRGEAKPAAAATS